VVTAGHTVTIEDLGDLLPVDTELDCRPTQGRTLVVAVHQTLLIPIGQMHSQPRSRRQRCYRLDTRQFEQHSQTFQLVSRV